MKNNILSTLAIIPALAMLASCSENAWNEKYLDGFEEPPVYQDIQEINYTLTDADYSTIANSSANQALATTEAEKEALKAIGENKCFATVEQAQKYIPALLSMSSFQYFTLDNGSSIVVKYNLTDDPDSTISSINANTPEYRVTEEEYMEAWGSGEDYINGFAPMNPASSHLPEILAKAYPEAEQGQYVVVNYNEATTNPIFGTVSGGDEPGGEEPGEFEMTDVLKDVKLDQQLNVKGIVTAINTAGFVVTDLGGSIFYYDRNFNDDSITIGSEVEVSGSVGIYNRGLQVSIDQSYKVVGTTSYQYPEPDVYNGSMVEALCKGESDIQAKYVQISGTVSISGNYTNIIIEGTDCQASPYSPTEYIKSLFVDGQSITLTGYLTYVASSRYLYIIVTGVEAANGAYNFRKPVGTVETVSKNAVYMFDGGKWVTPPNTIVLQPQDYSDMNQSYGNLSNDLPSTLLPIYLDKNYPYASEDDIMIVLYKYYNGSSTSYQASQFVNDGNLWTGWIDENFATDRFSRTNNTWMWNPSVSITLPYERNNVTSVTFYQACCDWVYENIDVPYYGSTSITDGKGFVTTYGNNEYYTGASAYYCNVDIRGAKALEQCSTGFGDFPGYGTMTEDEIVESMKMHFDYEVAPAVLGKLYPDAAPISGVTVNYSVTFTAYTTAGSLVVTGTWEVVAPGQFEFRSSTWWD